MLKLVKLGCLISAALAITLPVSLVAEINETKALTVTALRLPRYERPQKVVYHVSEGDSLLHHHSNHVVQVIQNHLNAVEKGRLDLRVVLQGDGLDLLIHAKKDAKFAATIDTLKGEGIRFLVCRNSMMSRGLDFSDLYAVPQDDVVSAAVAEITALEAQGFVYLKP